MIQSQVLAPGLSSFLVQFFNQLLFFPSDFAFLVLFLWEHRGTYLRGSMFTQWPVHRKGTACAQEIISGLLNGLEVEDCDRIYWVDLIPNEFLGKEAHDIA